MASIARCRVTWAGTPITGPGVSTFYVSGTVTAGWPAALKTLFTSFSSFVPTGVTFTIPNDVDILDEATGEITGANSPGGGGTVPSAGGAVDYKPGVGIRVRWGTAGVVGGRRVKGTTFLVPVTSQEIPNGILQSSTVAGLTTAANTYKNNVGFSTIVYSRPRAEHIRNGVVVPARAGAISPITSVSVPNTISWLRTRRT